MRKALQRTGTTLIELMVALAIFSFIALCVSTFIIDSLRVNYSVEAQTDASVIGQQGLDELRWRLAQSRRILDRDSGMLPLVDLQSVSAPAPAGEIRPPRIEANASLTPRAAGQDTFVQDSVGNALFFVESVPTYREPETGRLVDLYRFVLYYVGRKENCTFARMTYCLDLTRWESEVYADFQQIDSLEEEMQEKVVRGLASREITFAWDAGSPPAAAFSRLNSGRLVRPPEPRHRIAGASSASAVPGIGRGQRVSGVIGYTVAPNDGEIPVRNAVPKFAEAAAGFPLGFEVMIAGPGHGRKVLVRLVIAAEAQGRYYSREQQMLAAVWD